jgi:hypothetical protein
VAPVHGLAVEGGGWTLAPAAPVHVMVVVPEHVCACAESAHADTIAAIRKTRMSTLSLSIRSHSLQTANFGATTFQLCALIAQVLQPWR